MRRLSADEIEAHLRELVDGTAPHEHLKQRPGDCSVVRLHPTVDTSLVVKLWNRPGIRGSLRRITRTTPLHKETNALTRLRQFGINTPVREASRVRGVHVDNPMKIFNALLYMRLDEDDSEGGEFQICKFTGRPRFHDQVLVSDEHVEVVNQIPYRANDLAFVINSMHALHAVSPRQPTPHIRRYVNFLAELRIPIFDLKPYQDTGTPWAVMAHKS